MHDNNGKHSIEIELARNELIAHPAFLDTMSGITVASELMQIRKRLEAIEDALGEKMIEDDKKSLEKALEEHKQGKSVPFKARKQRTRSA